MATTVLTTGYAGFKEDSFLWKLEKYGVEVVVDVRDRPVSRNRTFTQSQLQPMLEDNGIEYVHCGELGVPSDLRQELRNGGDLQDYFDQYRAYLDGQQEALDDLYQLVTTQRCCLLCLEKKPEECHRSVVADVLSELNGQHIDVQHI